MLPTLKAIPPVPQACRLWSAAVIVSTINVNGIRAATKQRSPENLGLLPWLDATTADVVCLQETRADDEQLAGALAPALSDGWHLASAGGDRRGRNGVAVLSRHPIKAVKDLGADEFALHGRYVEVDIDGLTVASVYVQTGEAGTDRQLEKERFMAALAHRMATLTDRDAVVCGDWNVAHTENDIKNWKGNVKKSGFLPSERQWLTDLLGIGLGRRGAGAAPGRRRPVLMVVVARKGVRQRRRLAHRLPIGDQRSGGTCADGAGGAGPGLRAALVRPRAGDGRVFT